MTSKAYEYIIKWLQLQMKQLIVCEDNWVFYEDKKDWY